MIAKESRQFGKFIVVGILNTAFGYGTYAAFLYIGLHYAAASFLATILGVVFNFFTTGRLVFQNSDNSRIFGFFLVYGIVYVFNLAGLSLLDKLQFNLYLAGLIMIPPAAILAYVLNRRFVFGGKR